MLFLPQEASSCLPGLTYAFKHNTVFFKKPYCVPRFNARYTAVLPVHAGPGRVMNGQYRLPADASLPLTWENKPETQKTAAVTGTVPASVRRPHAPRATAPAAAAAHAVGG